EAADMFAAVAPGAGGIVITDCQPSRPVSVLALHGDADPIVNYGTSYKPSLDAIAAADGCTTETIPATQPMSTDEATCITYSGCWTGIEVTGCPVASGGHGWFGDETCGTGDTSGIGTTVVGNNSQSFDNTDAAWAFLKRFALPEPTP